MSTHTPAPSKGAIVIDINVSALAQMDGAQIYALIDVFQTLDDVLSGLICQTRFANEDGGLNAAGTVLAEYSDSFTKVKELVADEAKSRIRTPTCRRGVRHMGGRGQLHASVSYGA